MSFRLRHIKENHHKCRHPIKCCFNNAKQTQRYSYLNCQVDNSLMWKIYSPTIPTTTNVRRMHFNIEEDTIPGILAVFCFYLPLIFFVFFAVSGEIFIVCDDFHFNPCTVGRSRCVNLSYGASETKIQNQINNSLRKRQFIFSPVDWHQIDIWLKKFLNIASMSNIRREYHLFIVESITCSAFCPPVKYQWRE